MMVERTANQEGGGFLIMDKASHDEVHYQLPFVSELKLPANAI